jgi:hypothetical protein
MALHENPSQRAASRWAPLAQVSSGWLESPYGERASVSIVREPTVLIVWQGAVSADRRGTRGIVYKGRSVRDATRFANRQMHSLRLRGFRARATGAKDRDFAISEVSRTLDVALDQ